MIGNIFLTLALLAGVFTMTMYYFTYKEYNNTLKLARIGYHIMTVLVISASLLLLHAILTHNYELKYVYNYSGSDLSTGLLMSTFWAGQEGSFMLWTLLTVIVELVLLEYTSRRGDLEPRVMMVFALAVSFLLVMVNPLLKSPFNYIWTEPTFIEIGKLNQSLLNSAFLSNFFFSDPGSGKDFVKVGPELVAVLKANGITLNQFIIEGKGLNPLLQNFWMQIHPPMLFVGFALATVPFSFAFAALIKNEYNDWVKQSLPWMLVASAILGLAIMLGGYWAYGVLGWGGYWGWDPVENSSLVPWLISVAAIHTMLVQKRSQTKNGVGRFVKTNLILSIMTYVLVLYSTFLTRSGILGDSSVHSFVSPGAIVYLFLVLFLGSFTLLGIGGIAYRWKYLNKKFNYEENILSRELALFTGSVAIIASAIIILIGTSAPIFGQSVELKFYNESNLPIAIIIGIVNGLSLLLKWKQTEGKSLLKNSRFAIAATIVSTILIVVFGEVTNFMLALFTLTTSFALWVNIEIASKIIKGRKTFLGPYVAHFGLALFFLGVIATGGFTEDKQINLVKGETVNALGYDLTFNGYRTIEGGKYAFDIDVRKGDNQSIVSPVMYVAEFNNSLMREPDIWSKFTKDFYIAPVGYNSGEEEQQSNANVSNITMNKGDSQEALGAKITFSNFNLPGAGADAMMSGGVFKVAASLIVEVNNKSYSVEPYLEIQNGERKYYPAAIEEENLNFQLTSVEASSGSINLTVANIDGSEQIEPQSKMKETLTIDASIKPFINLVWLGTLIMVLGYILAAVRRTKESQK